MELWHLIIGIIIALILHDEKNLRKSELDLLNEKK